ncbi:sn-glycerol-1-phosphate dehydrogenase [Micropruina sonneratiae]|uniref:sn-glycerol-1-phosphate dehydrogenase n=1 Tax=Micropruina sonneratiae TaxID=2986940 RepID=UPI002227FCDA|nr:sn-glycerol-1-phosphate dehydrogenase [Micropruina sp. KQZ13P-5]MCW3158639.1 sn-glycerol-1-phosphate dehydrogenase [Micropruina sp. KQZ13P-5]
MNTEMIEKGLAQADQTRVVEVGRGLLPRSGALIRDAMATADQPMLVVADERTWAAAGEAVDASLRGAGVEVAAPLIFPGSPALYAAYEHCETIRERLRSAGAVGVAVGSGTLNDLVKLASGELEQPYAVVGTAASMDGYTGFGAPMTRAGVKVTMPCPAPRVVLFDLDVAAAAPGSMVAAGYGDLSAKIPGGADWLLSDAVGWEPLHPLAWELVQGGVADVLAQPKALAAGDPDAYSGLVNGLILSGLAMQVYGGTRPASGAEHYFSHLWELEHLGQDREPPLSHGFKVAIGTLAMCAFYERFLARTLTADDVERALVGWPDWASVEADIRSRTSGTLAEHCLKETRAKYLDRYALAVRLGGVLEQWDALHQRLVRQLVPAHQLQAMLRQAGAPSAPEDIGLTADRVRETFFGAVYYRSRYSVLDLARELGWFDQLVDEVFQPGGLWT